MLEVDEEDPERMMMTSVDDEGVNALAAMKTMRAAMLDENSTGDEATLRTAPLSVPIASEVGPRSVALRFERTMQRQPEAWRSTLAR
uniref:Uncharacterized protein n=1 Tax=Oryza meridionalis TaxID=40149 RepID=A0A0E0F5A5_9ORYZ